MEPNINSIRKSFSILEYIEELKDIPTLDVGKYHGFFYGRHKFKNNLISKPELINPEHEYILCDGFGFLTMKNDTCVSDSLRSGILFEKFLLSFVSKFVPENKNMLDIGANIGVWSIVYSSFIKGQIHSFEPQVEIHTCLTKNIQINNCKNIKSHNIALSDEKTTLKMNASYLNQDNFGAFRICPDGILDIQTDTGDSLNLTNIGFIKMDVEGHELKVLQGLEETILREKPILFIEIHMADPNSNETFLFIKSLGYKTVAKLTHCDYLFIV